MKEEPYGVSLFLVGVYSEAMNRRTVEFFLVLVVAAVVAAFSLREKAEEPYELVESPLPSAVDSLPTASPSVPNVSPSPIRATVLYTPVVREDYELAEGLSGYEEVLGTRILEPTQERIERGAKLYQDNCALCHGSIGKGDGYGGSRLDPPPTNLTRPGDYKYGRRELAVYRTGRYGVDGTGMVPWDGILSNEELWCITHYVMFLQEED